MSNDSKQRSKIAITALGGTIAGFILCLFLYSFLPALKPASQVYAEPNTAEAETIENFQNGFRKVAAETLPWVVEINTVKLSSRETAQANGFPWDYFFGNPGEGLDGTEPDVQEFRSAGLGSGFIVEKDKNTYYVVTNYHVCGKADEITVKLDNGIDYDAELVGSDPRKDLALVKFETKDKGIPVANLGDSDSLFVGDWVLAIGSPFGYKFSVTAGIISALGRQNGPDGNINDFIQTDAAINQGNSGGPLVNLKGEVIGINTWITTSGGGSIGLGFSIPINNVKRTIRDFIDNGEVRYGWLGVSIGDLPELIADEFELKGKKGAFVYQVFNNSPAEKGGLCPGDFILSVNGVKATDKNHLTRMIGDMRPDDIAEFVLMREDRQMSLKVKITEREAEEEVRKMNNQAWPGVSVFTVQKELLERLELPEETTGVFVAEVYPKTSFQIAGIQAGDIITGINGVVVKNLGDFYSILNDLDDEYFYISSLREGVEMESSKLKRK
ncbi:MAG: hypothetical protein B6241_08955 [Spirochaetaceae bacterium 4572_59]|nr:MAG: hypothetical protein B6241_08955 [Spirochaetaceae bacterium 4572_59]